MNFKSLPEAIHYFKDEQVCRDTLAKLRWPDGNIICPKCGTHHAYLYGNLKWYKCSNKQCKARFTVTVGTIYEGTKLPLSKWFVALWLISAHKKGISSLQLSRDLGIGQKAAWFVNHRIRQMMEDKAPQMLDNVVEVDETYVKGKLANKSKSKRALIKDGKMEDTTVPVMGLVERDGKAILKIINQNSPDTFKDMVRRYVKPDAVIVTDSHLGYKGLDYEYVGHVTVNHSNYEYKTGIYHTNTVEGFFSNLKRGVFGIYHFISPKHTHRYLNEFSARYNSRKIKDDERFIELMKQPQGRLKYKDLIAKK